MSGSIVVIDSDPRTCEALYPYFAREHLHLIPATQAQSGLALVEKWHPDALLLEVILPDLDGWSVLRRARCQLAYEQPIMMLSDRHDLQDRIMGLDLGADDYLCKPFEPLEVLARLKAICRRTHPQRLTPDRIQFPGLIIDVTGYLVWRHNSPVSLTCREFKILLTLARHPHRIVTRQHLLEAAWGENAAENAHALDICMNRLRNKLYGKDARHSIKTIRGTGYQFNP